VYHVVLDLNHEQVKQLKALAVSREISVKELVAQLVIKELDQQETIEPKTKK
jgi:hypothetical protein